LITIKGKLNFIDIGTGQWELETATETYRIIPAIYSINVKLQNQYTLNSDAEIAVYADLLDDEIHVADHTSKRILIVFRVN
jgi:hypothetical protein